MRHRERLELPRHVRGRILQRRRQELNNVFRLGFVVDAPLANLGYGWKVNMASVTQCFSQETAGRGRLCGCASLHRCLCPRYRSATAGCKLCLAVDVACDCSRACFEGRGDRFRVWQGRQPAGQRLHDSSGRPLALLRGLPRQAGRDAQFPLCPKDMLRVAIVQAHEVLLKFQQARMQLLQCGLHTGERSCRASQTMADFGLVAVHCSPNGAPTRALGRRTGTATRRRWRLLGGARLSCGSLAEHPSERRSGGSPGPGRV
mmetsp:Transcript_39260/g.108184  ORF Transcript_39260/g.108184 Transcript_39260/m.108184 type:complete len:260 (+) Transcript_39260:1345-2124(+)